MTNQRSRARTAPSKPAPRQQAAGIAKPSTTAASERIDVVDAARGLAILMMIAYHFCFDLTYYRWADWPMLDDPRWIAWRSAIVTCFVFLVGISLALRDDRERHSGRSAWLDRGFVRRWLQVASAAALVTGGSALLFPETFIYFGVLHFVAVALWLCRRAPRRPWLAIVAAAVALSIGILFDDPTFDPRLVNWIGFATDKPLTEDYVPLFPWLGITLIGCAVGGWWARRGLRLSPALSRAWQALPSPARRLLATMGRWSLTIYLLHQPLMLGAMGLIRRVA